MGKALWSVEEEDEPLSFQSRKMDNILRPTSALRKPYPQCQEGMVFRAKGMKTSIGRDTPRHVLAGIFPESDLPYIQVDLT